MKTTIERRVAKFLVKEFIKGILKDAAKKAVKSFAQGMKEAAELRLKEMENLSKKKV